MLIKPISRELFSIFALSLPKGPNFEPLTEVSWWSAEGCTSVGVVTHNSQNGAFGGIALRRDVDHRFIAMPP
jgi:hypothetical protein